MSNPPRSNRDFLDQAQRRDRALAARPRWGARKAAPVETLVGQLMSSPEMRRIHRQRFVAAALSEVLTEQELLHVRAVRSNAQGLTLSVDNAPLLAELRQFRYQALLEACNRHGLGVSAIRLVKNRSGGP